MANSPLALYVVDSDGVVEMWNPGAERLYGWSASEVVGRRLPIVGPGHRREFDRLRRAAMRGEPSLEHETVRSCKDGRTVAVAISTVPLADETSKVRAVLGVSRDISARKTAEAALRRQIRIDTLTGVETRAWFLERLETDLADSHTGGGLILLDIVDFKSVNETYGHAVGDELLELLALRVRDAIRNADHVGRLGGDEFAIFVPGSDDRAVRGVATRILESLGTPFRIGNLSFVVRASAGGVHFEAAPDIGDVFRAADLALYEAKRLSRGGFRMYDQAMHAASVERLAVENRLWGASAAGEMVLHYQPIVDVATGRLTGAEALVRWNHPELGLLPPARFIAAAEMTGEIIPLGDWVAREACRQGQAWLERHPDLSPFTMSVNLSSSQLRDPELPVRLAAIMEESGFPSEHLQLEITESVLATNDAPDIVHRLRDLGVGLAIDDFGTGYSSLSSLRRFPFTVLKVDQSFVAGCATSVEDRVIVSATIGLADNLGLTSVAEGVETDEQLQVLATTGCVEAQGYLFGRPVPAGELGERLDRPPVPPDLRLVTSRRRQAPVRRGRRTG